MPHHVTYLSPEIETLLKSVRSTMVQLDEISSSEAARCHFHAQLEAVRETCRAIERMALGLDSTWEGLEMLDECVHNFKRAIRRGLTDKTTAGAYDPREWRLVKSSYAALTDMLIIIMDTEERRRIQVREVTP